MPALVPELVNMASDPAITTADLLRRSLVVARRLAVPEIADWITFELEGYGKAEIPEYRILKGRPQVFNPYHGYQPLVFPTAELMDIVSKANVRQSIPELDKLAQSESGIKMHFPTALEHMLRNSMSISLDPSLHLSTVQLHGIVEKVRSQILKWALDLESKGVLGEGMSFTQQEKKIVQAQHYHFSNVSGSQIQISSNGSTQTQNSAAGIELEDLKSLVQALSVIVESTAGEDVEELKAELATLKAQADSPKPKWEIIKATARSIKNIAEGSAGAILAGLAQPHLATLLALGKDFG